MPASLKREIIKKMRTSLILTLFLLSLNSATAQVSIAQLDLPSGTYNVGFTHYTTTDSSRTYNRIFDWTNTAIPRPVPVSIWYPSHEKTAHISPLKVLDYMRILKEEEEWEHLPDDQILNWFYYPNTPTNQNQLQESTTAYHALSPANDKFPVIIYAPSYQASSIENFALCEMLASHGYVVVSGPSRGTENRFFEGGTQKDMEAQARDIEFLIKESLQLRYADSNNIAAMGFSFGGLAQVLTQMRNKSIKAMVSLDGSIKYQYGTLKTSPFYNIENMNIPFIHFSQKEIPSQVLIEDKIDPKLNTEFEFFDSLKYSHAYHLQFHHLTHSYFSTLGVLFQPRDPRQDKEDAEIMASYRWVTAYTLHFFDAFLKNRDEGLAFLNREPAQNTHMPDLISKETKLATTGSFTFRDFNDLARSQNYNNLEGLYDSLKNYHSPLNIPEGNLNNLGLQLVFNPKEALSELIFLFLPQHCTLNLPISGIAWPKDTYT